MPPDDLAGRDRAGTVRAALNALQGVAATTDPRAVERASRDMSAVLSPVLAESFADRRADAVLMPRDESEVLAVLSTAARYGLPVIPRGAGTCNFGQSIPLNGGLMLDLRALTGVVERRRGMWRAWTGTLLSDIDDVLTPHGEEMRLYPSSKRIGTIGGYVVGGHAGIGAIRHGVLADAGNIAGLRVLTLEETPRALEIRGPDVNLVHFSFGTAGVVTQVEMPSTVAWDWRDVALTFPTLDAATAFALETMMSDGIDVKNVHPVDATIAAALTPLALPATAAALVMVAPQSSEALRILAETFGGQLAYDVALGAGPRSIPFFEYTWGHSVWWLRKQAPMVATLIALLPEQDPLGAMRALRRELDPNVAIAVSCKRFAGRPALQLAVCLPNPSMLGEASRRAADLGCSVANTHRPVLSDTSIYAFEERQRAFKSDVDPLGLLNPGKLAGFDSSAIDDALGDDIASSGFTSRRSTAVDTRHQ
jgi:FAD/FMN-containing dehydrogenase